MIKEGKTLFAFSDETADEKQKGIYIRGSLVINSFEYRDLKEKFYEIKDKILGKYLLLDTEIKYQDLWLKKKMEQGKEKGISKKKEFLKYVNFKDLLSFIEGVFELLNQCESTKVLYTCSLENDLKNNKKTELFKEHLHIHIQRIDMDCRDHDSFVCFFFDHEKSLEKLFQNAYAELIKKGDAYREYKNSKDSLNFEISHHSVGIQIVDYLSGCFKNFLKGYDDSLKLFKKYILEKVRKVEGKIYRWKNNELDAYGIIEIPINKGTPRLRLREKIVFNLLDEDLVLGNITEGNKADTSNIYHLFDFNEDEQEKIENNKFWYIVKTMEV